MGPYGAAAADVLGHVLCIFFQGGRGRFQFCQCHLYSPLYSVIYCKYIILYFLKSMYFLVKSAHLSFFNLGNLSKIFNTR